MRLKKAEREQVRMKYGGRCAYCGNDLGERWHADHFAPVIRLPDDRVVAANASGIVIRDAYPVSPGHTLIISRRHVGSLFDLTPAERVDLLALLDQARANLEPSCRPDGYNVGINDGPAAGQTVPHLACT